MANTKLPARLLDTSAVPALNVTGDLTVDTTTLKVDSSNNRVKIGDTAVASATNAPLHVAKSSTDVQAIFGDNNTSIDDPSIRIIGRDTGNSAIRYMFAGLDADANHGFVGYNHGSGSFTNALNFDTSGKVGIGTDSPQDKLHVYDGDIGIENSSGRRYRLIAEASGGFTIRDQTSSAGRFAIDTSGNIGIGIPSPDSALHVQSGSAGSVTAYSDTTFTTEASSTNHFWSILGPANQNQGILFGDADSNWRGQVRYAHNGDYMQLYAGQQDSPPALSIVSADEGRSLGVKNSNPKAHLHVGGHGVAVNTTLDVSRTAIFRTDGTGNYSSSGNKSAAHAATFMRSSDAVTGDQVGHSYVFDNGNWSATAEIMAEVESDANAYSRLNFKTWNGSMLTRQVITSDGMVIKPYQSGFYAVKSSGQTISVNQAVIFNTATENVGADYNTSNGVYTAPYSGFYLFSYTILLGPNLTNDIDVDHYLKTSNRNYIGGHPGRTRYLSTGTSGWGDGYMGFGHTQIAYMDANDTAYVDFSQLYYNGSNGTAPVYANTSNRNPI